MARGKLNHMPHVLQREAEAKARPPIVHQEYWCVGCGQSACFGYGVFRDERPGAAWACSDSACREEAQRLSAEAIAAPAAPVRPIDLFTAPMAAE